LGGWEIFLVAEGDDVGWEAKSLGGEQDKDKAD